MGRGLRLKLFAALLLRAMAQEQVKEGTEGVSPRHPNVARRLGLEADSPELAIGERYLEEQGYIRASAPGKKAPTSSSRRWAGRIWGTGTRRRGGSGNPGGGGCSGSRSGTPTGRD
jgi:hypothetical protein